MTCVLFQAVKERQKPVFHCSFQLLVGQAIDLDEKKPRLFAAILGDRQAEFTDCPLGSVETPAQAVEK